MNLIQSGKPEPKPETHGRRADYGNAKVMTHAR
jgi:hypothetical protein